MALKYFYRNSSNAGVPVAMPGSNPNEFPNAMATIIAGYGQVNISSIVIANGLARVTTTSNAFKPCMVVLISGSTTTGINGEWKIAVVESTTVFTFYTSITGPVAGTMTVKVAPLAMTVSNPSANVYYYGVGGRYLKTVNSATTIDFYVTDSLSDTNITTKKTAWKGTEYLIVTDGDFFYFFSTSGTLIFTPIGSAYYFNDSLSFGSGTGIMSPTITTAKIRGFIEHSYPCGNSRANTDYYEQLVDMPISVWQDDNTINGYLPRLADIAFARGDSVVHWTIYFHCVKTYICFKYSSEPRLVDVS